MHRLVPTVSLPLLIVGLVACGDKDDDSETAGWLDTKGQIVDFGYVALGDSEEGSLGLELGGSGQADVIAVSVEGDGFTGTPELSTYVCGERDCTFIQGLAFEPTSEGEHRGTLRILTNASEAHSFDAEGRGVYELPMRGIGKESCMSARESGIDFGAMEAGGLATGEVHLRNCGPVRATVLEVEVEGSGAFSSDSALPHYILPEGEEAFELHYAPDSTDGDEGLLVLRTTGDDVEVSLYGNLCDEDDADCMGSDWSDDDGDGFSEMDGDCDDSDADVHPEASESDSGVDEDCDGKVDEGSYSGDDDFDGHTEIGETSDCNDADPWSYPGATEDCDGRDNDCDGLIDEGSDDTEDAACPEMVEVP